MESKTLPFCRYWGGRLLYYKCHTRLCKLRLPDVQFSALPRGSCRLFSLGCMKLTAQLLHNLVMPVSADPAFRHNIHD